MPKSINDSNNMYPTAIWCELSAYLILGELIYTYRDYTIQYTELFNGATIGSVCMTILALAYIMWKDDRMLWWSIYFGNIMLRTLLVYNVVLVALYFGYKRFNFNIILSSHLLAVLIYAFVRWYMPYIFAAPRAESDQAAPQPYAAK